MKYRGISRRGLLRMGAAALAPMVLPAETLGLNGRVGPNSRVRTGHVGLGWRGAVLLDLLRDNAAAICDVDGRRLDAGATLAGSFARRYDDYRRLLDDREVDGVVIATPDHWHAAQARDAMAAGKDVYLESPACLTLGGAAAIRRSVQRSGAVLHLGQSAFWRVGPEDVDLAPHAVYEAVCWGEDNSRGPVPAGLPAPEQLEWDRWVGPARWQPYEAALVDGGWRYNLGFGGGAIASLGVHAFARTLEALQLNALGTVRVSASGAHQYQGIYDAPQNLQVTFELRGIETKIRWRQRKLLREEMAYGATLKMPGKSVQITPILSRDPRAKSAPEREAARIGTQNWLEDVVSRPAGREGLNRGLMAASLAALGSLAFRLGRDLTWDDETQRFANDPMADRMVTGLPWPQNGDVAAK